MKNFQESHILCTSCCKENSWSCFFKTYDPEKDLAQCEFCQSPAVLVDSAFVPVAKNLWSKGYATKFSCMGHEKSNHSSFSAPYIYFTKPHKFKSLPKGWVLEKRGLFPKLIIRYTKKDLKKAVRGILDWSEKLPSIPKETIEPVELKLPIFIKSPLKIFYGEESFKKNQAHFKNYRLRRGKKLSEINRSKSIIYAKDLIRCAFELEINPLKKDIVVIFPLIKEKEKNLIPYCGRGWGAFKNAKFFGLFRYLISKQQAELYTGDQAQVFKIK